MSGRGLRAVWLAVAVVLCGCDWGTLSEDELLADYQVEPVTPPDEMVVEVFEDLADELDTGGVELVELNVYAHDFATVLASHPGEGGRIYDFRHNGWWIEDEELESTDVEAWAPRRFRLDELPIDKIPAMVELGRAQMGFEPASFSGLEIVRDEEPPHVLTLTVSYRNFDHSGRAVFDGDGELVEAR